LGFVEVWISTPLEVCEGRDPKGLYARVRAGEMTGLTGVDDPYEPPLAPDVVIDTATVSVDAAAASVLAYLRQ
jgi:adenylylsulfate kinase-like enzyme